MYSDQTEYYGGGYGEYYYPQNGQGGAPGYGDPNNQGQQGGYGGNHNNQQQQQQGGYYPPQGPGGMMGEMPFNPVITNLATQYGQNLVGQGKFIVDEKIQKFVSVSKLKYYFAVDTTYVIKKMGLLFFPFTHKVH